MDLRTILHTAIDEGLSKFANALLRHEDHQRPGQGKHVREDEYSEINEYCGHSQRPANIQYPGNAEERRPQEDVPHSAPIQKRRRSNSFVDHTQAEENLGPAASKRRKTTKTIMDPTEHGHDPRGTPTPENISPSRVVESVESPNKDAMNTWRPTLPADPECPELPGFATASEGDDTLREEPNVSLLPILGQMRNPGPNEDCEVCHNWIKYYRELSNHTDLQRRYEDTSRIPRLFVRSGVNCDCDYDRDEWRLSRPAKDGELFSCGYGLRNIEPYVVLHLTINQMCDELPSSGYGKRQTDPYLYLERMERGVCDVCRGWQRYHAEVRELAEQTMTQYPRKHFSEVRPLIESQIRTQDHERLPRLFEESGLECSCTEETKLRTLEASLSAGVPSQNVNFDSFKECEFGTRYKSPEAFITPRDSKNGVCGYCKRWERYGKDVSDLSDEERQIEDLQRVPLLFANGPFDCTCTRDGENYKRRREQTFALHERNGVGPLLDSPRSFLQKYGDFYPASGKYKSRMGSGKEPWVDDDAVATYTCFDHDQIEYFLEDKILRPYQRQQVIRLLMDGDDGTTENFVVFNIIRKVVVRYKEDMEHLDTLLKLVASRLKEPIPELDEALELIRKVRQGDHDGDPIPEGEEDVPMVSVVDNKDADAGTTSERVNEQI